MKIFCIGRNYVDHAKELGNKVPDKPMVFMKPYTALLKNNKPFYYPEFSQNIHYELELVIKICKNGKYIQKDYAREYYDEIGLGIDFTARDLQNECKKKGHPWEIAKGFDNSAALSEFKSLKDFDKTNIPFRLMLNENEVQNGTSKDMIFDFNTLVSYVSTFFTLQLGDLIYTGTPAGVGAIEIGDQLEGFLGDESMLKCQIK